MKKLIITEKPSVAIDIAKVLLIDEKHNGYIENDEYIISWCYGHLIQNVNAEDYDEKYKQWNIEDLPIIPQKFKYKKISSAKEQYNILEKLLKRDDVDIIICATDSGREGELIFRNVYNYANCKKPVERLWISSMEESEIIKGFDNLKSSNNYDNLYYSARCRSEADWIVGINATRLFSCIYKSPLNIGRVQTPTLSLVVDRTLSRKQFKKQKIYKIKIEFNNFIVSSEIIENEDEAKNLLKELKSSPFIVKSISDENKKTSSPTLYDLTSLQKQANNKFKYSAKKTLDIIQSLYEKKYATYPRTDSKYLNSSMKEKIEPLVKLSKEFLKIDNNDEIYVDKVIDDSKVSDHHAIIPTKNISDISQLNKDEINILTLLCDSIVIATSDDYKYNSKTATIENGDYSFKYTETTPISLGFKKYSKSEQYKNKSKNVIETLNINQELDINKIEIIEDFTKPKPYYTESTLLRDMEKSGAKEITEKDAERKGLGTSATRANIIEQLIKNEYIKREENSLIATEKGINLLKIVPNELKSPSMTADWENKLTLITKNEYDYNEFMEEIKSYIDMVVKKYSNEKVEDVYFKLEKEELGKCPKCNSNIYESKTNYYCENKECNFCIFKNNKFFEKIRVKLSNKIVKDLLRNKKTLVHKIYSEKKDKEYKGYIELDLSDDKWINFKISF